MNQIIKLDLSEVNLVSGGGKVCDCNNFLYGNEVDVTTGELDNKGACIIECCVIEQKAFWKFTSSSDGKVSSGWCYEDMQNPWVNFAKAMHDYSFIQCFCLPFLIK